MLYNDRDWTSYAQKITKLAAHLRRFRTTSGDVIDRPRSAVINTSDCPILPAHFHGACVASSQVGRHAHLEWCFSFLAATGAEYSIADFDKRNWTHPPCFDHLFISGGVIFCFRSAVPPDLTLSHCNLRGGMPYAGCRGPAMHNHLQELRVRPESQNSAFLIMRDCQGFFMSARSSQVP